MAEIPNVTPQHPLAAMQGKFRKIFLENPDGKAVLEFLDKKFYYRRTTHHPEPTEASFRAGQSLVVNSIHGFLERDLSRVETQEPDNQESIYH